MEDKIAACSWSSGKDSCFACYKAIKNGYKIKHLMNFVSQEFQRVSFHGVPRKFVGIQADALEIELLQKEVPTGKYEQVFRETLRFLKSQGTLTLVAGDIFLLDCKNWVEEICKDEGLKLVEPLWEKPSKEILSDFINSGFKAVVTATQAKLMGKEWVGRLIDEGFIRDLEKLGNIDLCGENGEYHTFVFDGPIFKNQINIGNPEKVMINDYWFLDIQGAKK